MSRHLQIMYYVEPDPAALACRAAQYFVEMAGEAVAAQGCARIAISGGSTPLAAFEALADPDQPWRNRMPWDMLDLYWVDERCVSPDDPASNYRMTREALLDHAPLRPEQIHRIEGELEPDEAAARYESELRIELPLEGRREPALRSGGAGHGQRRPHRLALSAHRGRSTKMSRLADRQPRATVGCLARHPHLAGHQPRPFRLLSSSPERIRPLFCQEVLTGPLDPERLPSQLIWPSSGILTFILDKAAAALLPATDAEGCGVLERER